MLGADALSAHLARITYRRGWTFELVDDPEQHEGLKLRIVARVEDSYRPGEYTELRICSYLPPMADEAAFEHWLFWRLRRIEIHECGEWFKVDGIVAFDPHSETAADC